MSRYKKIVVICPICKKVREMRYSREQEILLRYHGAQRGVDNKVFSGKNIVFYVPCRDHEKEFDSRVAEYRDRHIAARSFFKKILEKELSDLSSRIVESAIETVKKLKKEISLNEGLVFWVSESGHSESDNVKAVYAIIVKQNEKLFYNCAPLVSYKKGERYSQAHYLAQDALYYINIYDSVKWRGFIQGLNITNRKDLEYILRAIFFWTHSRPEWTLVDFLRDPPRELYGDFTKILEKYSKSADERFWSVVDTRQVVEKTRRRTKEKYGVDPVEKLHVKDIFDV